jgi:hypothetical protein
MNADRIYKWPLQVTDRQTVPLPRGAVILTVQAQRDELVLWAAVDSTAPTDAAIVNIVGTGNPMPSVVGDYVATVQQHGGALVWHVFIEAAS